MVVGDVYTGQAPLLPFSVAGQGLPLSEIGGVIGGDREVLGGHIEGRLTNISQGES